VTNPFAHDTTSNASTDFSFADDQGVPGRHLESFVQAMGSSGGGLSETDYRFPAGAGGDEALPAEKPQTQVKPWTAPGQQRDGYYPKGYAP